MILFYSQEVKKIVASTRIFMDNVHNFCGSNKILLFKFVLKNGTVLFYIIQNNIPKSINLNQ